MIPLAPQLLQASRRLCGRCAAFSSLTMVGAAPASSARATCGCTSSEGLQRRDATWCVREPHRARADAGRAAWTVGHATGRQHVRGTVCDRLPESRGTEATAAALSNTQELRRGGASAAGDQFDRHRVSYRRARVLPLHCHNAASAQLYGSARINADACAWLASGLPDQPAAP